MKCKIYNKLFSVIRNQGYSVEMSIHLVAGYAKQDLSHYGKRKWMKESGQLEAARKWAAK